MKNYTTLLASEHNITTCNIVRVAIKNDFRYELRYYAQLEMLEIVKMKNVHSDVGVSPVYTSLDPIKILKKLREDDVHDFIYYDWERLILQFADGDRECLRMKESA